MLWPNWSSKILAGNAIVMAVFVITVEKRIISPRYENHGFAGKSKTNFRNYSNSIMTFLSRTHNYVGDNSNDCLDIDEIITDLPNLFKINDHKVAKINVKSLSVNVTVENISVSLEIDTEASVTVFSESFYLEKSSKKSSKLLPYNVTLSSYTTEPIIPSGKLNVNIPYRNEEQNLDVYVIENGAHPLMGGDWL